MIGRIKELYGEAAITVAPFVKSKKHKQYSKKTQHIIGESRGFLESILSFTGWNTSEPDHIKSAEMTSKEDAIKTLIELKQSIDIALDKNKFNLRTDLLDLIPVLVAKSGNPWMILVGVLGIGISIYGSLNEFLYRINTLNPKMKEAKEKYNLYMNNGEDSNVRTWYRDIVTDGVETTTEAVSFFLPMLTIASNLINFLIEIPMDVSSRNKYYAMGDETMKMFDDINNKDS